MPIYGRRRLGSNRAKLIIGALALVLAGAVTAVVIVVAKGGEVAEPLENAVLDEDSGRLVLTRNV